MTNLQLRKEGIDNLILFDGKRMKVDLFHTPDFACLYESSEFGDWLPFPVAC
jgi:hypothetical protein